MALGKSLALGAAAAVAIPYAIGDGGGEVGEWLRTGLARFTLGGHSIAWSWPLFAFVTLFAWGAAAWSNK